MFPITTLFFKACFLVYASSVSAGDPGVAPLTALPADVILVAARVTEVGAKRPTGDIPARLEVVHVYHGPPELFGKTFADSSREGDDSTGVSAHPPWRKGEEGLWSLRARDSEIAVWRDPWLPFAYRSRTAHAPRHEQARALAKAIERLAQTEPDQRIALATEFAQHPTPEISAWAIHALGASASDEAAGVLNDLAATENLPLAGQIALDEELCRRGTAWQTRASRMALLRSWVSGSAADGEAGQILRRIDLAFQRGELSGAAALELAGAASRNERFSTAVRRQALFFIGRIAGRPGEQENAFDYLAAQVREAGDDALRLAAALAIRNSVPPPDAKRAEVIRELLSRESSKEVAAALTEALRKQGR